MRRLATFIKAITFGGLFVLLPVVLVVLLFSKAVGTARTAAGHIIGLLTGQEAHTVQFPLLGGVLLVLLISFLLGLIMLSQRAAQLQRRIEQGMLTRVPGYAAVKNILYGLARSEQKGTVRPGLLSTSAEKQSFVFVMEEHGDGRMTIFVPSSPSAASGSVQIVPREQVRILNVGLASVISALNQWGVGTSKLLKKDLESATSSETGEKERP
jgi:uncharacterized membrane protein